LFYLRSHKTCSLRTFFGPLGLYSGSRFSRSKLCLPKTAWALFQNPERPASRFAFGPLGSGPGSRTPRSKLRLLTDWPLLSGHDYPIPRFTLGIPLGLYIRVMNDPFHPLSSDRSSIISGSPAPKLVLGSLGLNFRVANDPFQALSWTRLVFVQVSRTSNSVHIRRTSYALLKGHERLYPRIVSGPLGLLQDHEWPDPCIVFGPVERCFRIFGPVELCFRIRTDPLHALSFARSKFALWS
jgi:hypothetical protein